MSFILNALGVSCVLFGWYKLRKCKEISMFGWENAGKSSILGQ